MTKVHVKWGPKDLEVPCNPDHPVLEFMTTLQNVTGVPIDNQKLTMRRRQIKPGDSWKPGDITEKSRFMLIGTAELPPVNVAPPVEEEEINEDEEGKFTSKELEAITKGLPNLGNTCYLNSCLQTLRLLPECRDVILSSNVPPNSPNANVVRCLADLFRNFPQGLNHAFQALKVSNPALFNAVDEQGLPKQQDVTEAWWYIYNIFKNAIGRSFNNLFEITFEVRQSKLGDNAPASVTEETDNHISVIINEEVRQLEQGVKLDEDVESTGEGNTTIYRYERRIATLPRYLTFQMLRFAYKKDEQITAKLVRRVVHPMEIDTLQWLAPDLRKEIIAERENEENKSRRGYYKLKAVITHRGRSADSGHYITHVCVKGQWFRFDDMKVTEVDEEAIEMLAGSGDWHCSVLLIYESEE
ncbi:ubiquitin carboxyl-terminal hydrolase 14 [Histomonas meleagridis]|uniref:ubiquitin carboxyl-terminal hydrolase 14 n=1 Tax=Histomonas meleagridis TaxID=135588 RepID=UPI00355A368B|nr:ubiquitin carboxyl-terminal hydrolase 14 [Histomonas meleagridis]KAH0804145.1 ubiquitin carboxyl-terminal hydrolase 14 [Histomonas meleagridis]